MILVKVRVGPSPIHGMGLFASEFLAKGTPFWRFEPGFDRTFSPDDVQHLPPQAQTHVRSYAYLDHETGLFVLAGDHACFMNHSPSPNTGAVDEKGRPVVTVALRDIREGMELTCDYFSFDADAARKLAGPSG